jgi:hypothetical protein
MEAKAQAARDLTAALEVGWAGFEIGERFHLQRSHGRTNWRIIRCDVGELLSRYERTREKAEGGSSSRAKENG